MNFRTQKTLSIRHQFRHLPSTSLKKITTLLVMSLAANLFLAIHTWAFEIGTHEQLTEAAIDTVGSTLNTYLIDNLGLQGGLNASVKGGTPYELMKQGSKNEDTEAFAFRVFNHFHEPLFHGGLLWGDSAIEWSLKAIGSQAPGGQWSWNDAREYYFKALTSESKTDRDKYWGKTFEALGHVMHLIQDMASPAHVRNDEHPSLNGIGDVDGLHDFMDRRDVFGNIGPDPSVLEQAGAVRSEPFSNLFDQNAYTGENPDATLGSQAGLAEYTNANFFSDDTIPGQDIFFPNYTYPAIEELVPVGPASAYLTLPRLGNANSPSARAAKFTGNQAVATFLVHNTNLDLLGQLQLDDAVYDAQAQHLIPRAVGYSAAVLDYFFRGDLDTSGSTFVVNSGFAGPNPNDCDEVPLDPVGDLGPFSQNPSSSLRAEGKVSFYFDHSAAASSGTRELLFEGMFAEGEDLPGPASEDLVLQLSNFLHKDPVRWTIVIQGEVGPGEQEGQQKMNAIVAKSTLAEWEFECDH